MKLNKPFPYKTVIDREISNLNEIESSEVDFTEIISSIESLKPLLTQLNQTLNNGIDVNIIEPEPEPEPEPENGEE